MFIAKQVASQVIRTLPVLIAAIVKHDGDLADQLRRAGSSILLNVVEGNRRVGRDRLHFFRIAAGSAAEIISLCNADQVPETLKKHIARITTINEL